MNLNTNINLDRTVERIEPGESSMLFFSITYGKTRFRISAAQKILPKYWNKVTQQVKSHFPGSREINAILKKRKAEIELNCHKLIFNNKPVSKADAIKNLSFLTENNISVENFTDLYKNWMNLSTTRVSKHSKRI